MGHRVFFPAACALLALLCSACATAGSVSHPGSPADEGMPLNGMIYDADSRPVADMLLSLDGSLSARSDINGRFVFQCVARGDHKISASKEGWEAITLSFNYDNPEQIVYLKARSASELVDAAEKEASGGRWKEALALLDRRDGIPGICPDPAALYLRAVVFYRQGKSGEAARILRSLIGSGQDEASIHLFLADILQYELGDAPGAAAELEAYLRLESDPEAAERLDALKKAAEENKQ